MSWSIRNIIVTIINLALAVATFFLGFRILFELFGANPGTPIVAWIYGASAELMGPFIGIFPSLHLSTSAGSFGSTLDTTAVLALIVYATLAQLVIAGIDSVIASTETTTYYGHRHIG